MVVKAAVGWLNKDKPQAIANQTDAIAEALADPKVKVVYTNPVPELATVVTANSALKGMLIDYDVAGGGRQLSMAVTARKLEVASLVRQLASYVTSTANGNMENLLMSAFPIQKPNRQRIGQLPKPGAPEARQGKLSGQLLVGISPIYGAMTYNWRVALASSPSTYVQTGQTTAARTDFTGLTAGEVYKVEVSAVGAAGPSDWSDPGSLMVI